MTASSLADLQSALFKDVTVTIYGKEITFDVAIPDPAEFFRDLQIGNPILEALQESMKIVSDKISEDGKLQLKVAGLLGELSPLIGKAVNDKETYNSLIENINTVLVKHVQSPKLVMAGEEGGVPITNIPINAKFEMINQMYGGSGLLNSLSIFRNGSEQTVLTRRKSETVRKTAERVPESQ